MTVPVHVRMRARDFTEEHRASTPFELLYDLVFVVAIASLVTQFAASIAAGQLGQHVLPFMMVFFAIWWGWMNFTWFSSGYDSGDVLYRVFGLVQMGGVLVLAAGVPDAFESVDYRLVTAGYVVMRLGQVGLWLRAAIEHPGTRQVSTRYAIGIASVQVLWVLSLLLSSDWRVASFFALVACELAVPVWANRSGADPWHPGHIAERYGLFVIIILGEGVLAASNGVQAALSASGGSVGLVVVGLSGLVILVGTWWLYFLEPAEEGLIRRRHLSFYWGYGHVFLFAAVAAIGAGLEVAVEATGHHTKVADSVAGWVVAVPVALFLVLLWLLISPLVERHEVRAVVVFPSAVLVLMAPLATPVIGLAGVVLLIALLTAATVAVTLALGRRTGSHPQES